MDLIFLKNTCSRASSRVRSQTWLLSPRVIQLHPLYGLSEYIRYFNHYYQLYISTLYIIFIIIYIYIIVIILYIYYALSHTLQRRWRITPNILLLFVFVIPITRYYECVSSVFCVRMCTVYFVWRFTRTFFQTTRLCSSQFTHPDSHPVVFLFFLCENRLICGCHVTWNFDSDN